jgi:hypothetical protein
VRSSAEWQEVKIGEWLERSDEVIVNLANWSPERLVNRFDLGMRFRSGEAGFYDYFPFAFKISTNAPQAEIGKIEGPNQITELHLEELSPSGGGG